MPGPKNRNPDHLIPSGSLLGLARGLLDASPVGAVDATSEAFARMPAYTIPGALGRAMGVRPAALGDGIASRLGFGAEQAAGQPGSYAAAAMLGGMLSPRAPRGILGASAQAEKGAGLLAPKAPSVTSKMPDDDLMPLFHGSREPVAEIRDQGLFGGLFASGRPDAARAHGEMVHEIPLRKSDILTQQHLDYHAPADTVRDVIRANVRKDASDDEIDALWDAIVADKGVHNLNLPEERIAELLRSSDLAEAGWEAQRLRGVLAKRLGFKAVEMADEHGTSYLVLPGSPIRAGE